MPTNALSTSPTLSSLALLFATIFTAFGINALLRPLSALTFFALPPPSTPTENLLVSALLPIYGARDIFMGLAIYAAAYYRDRKCLGAVLVAASGVAVADGAVCWGVVGEGEWGHWGYAPVVAGVGGLLMGWGERV